MAKVTQPLMSGTASGKVGDIVFGSFRGRAVVRGNVTPRNPKSAAQAIVRNIQRISAAVQFQINHSTDTKGTNILTDKELLKSVAPAATPWNGYLVQKLNGSANANYTEAVGVYTALTAPQKADWTAAAVALVPPYAAVTQKGALDVAMTAATAGQVFFHHRYAMFKAGLDTVPTAVPPTYA